MFNLNHLQINNIKWVDIILNKNVKYICILQFNIYFFYNFRGDQYSQIFMKKVLVQNRYTLQVHSFDLTIIYYTQKLSMNLNNFVKRYVRLTNPEDIESYLFRESEQLPSTPKIYTGKKNQQILTVYVEKMGQGFNITHWKVFTLHKICEYLENIIMGFIVLRKRYGCFKVDTNLIRLSSKNSVKVWIHQDIVLNYCEKPLPNDSSSQLIMVIGIIKIFKQILPELNTIKKPDSLQALLQRIIELKSQLEVYKLTEQQIQNRKKLSKSYYEANKKPSSSNFLHSTSNQISKNQITNLIKELSPKLIIHHKKPSNFNEDIRRSQSNASQQRNQLIHSQPCYKRQKYKKQQDINKCQKGENTSITMKKTFQVNIYEKFEESLSKPQFPHSTESTFVTLKQTKSFDMNYFDNIVIQQQSEFNMKNSTQSNCKNSNVEVDLEADFDNLFVGEAQQVEQEFEQREKQFEGILFS